MVCVVIVAGVTAFRRLTLERPSPAATARQASAQSTFDAAAAESAAQEWREYLAYVNRPRQSVDDVALHPVWVALLLTLISVGALLAQVPDEERADLVDRLRTLRLRDGL